MSRSGRFRICDLVIESSIPLPELPDAAGASPECRLELSPAAELLPGDFQWFHHWQFPDEEKTIWLSIAREGESYRLRFPSYAEFVVSCGGRRVECRPLPDTPVSTVRHLFLDQVLPLILSRREPLVLHASAILTGRSVMAFAGSSGLGKSTLAASFGQSGYPLLSDDCLVLRKTAEGWNAVPSYPGVRLWPGSADGVFAQSPESREVAHYTSKLRVGDPAVVPFAQGPSPLRCLYFLEEEGEATQPDVSIQPLAPQDAFIRLVNFAYNLDITDKGFLKVQFEAIGQLTAEVSSYGLRYPRDFGALPTVRQAILSHQKGEDEE